MLKQRFAAVVAMIGLVFATIVGVSAPAAAANDDATLSGLSFSSGIQYRDAGLAPGFEATRTWYYYATTKQENTIVASANDSGATIQLLWDGNTRTVTSGTPETITFKISSFPMTVRVTASNGTTVKDYTVMMNVGVMMQPQFISITPNEGGDLAGEHAHLRLKNVSIPSNNNNSGCDFQLQMIYPDGAVSYMWGNFQSVDNNGVADYIVEIRKNWGNDWYEGKLDLRLNNYCWNSIDDQVGRWHDFYSLNVVKDAYEFKPIQLDTPPVLPEAQMTPTGRFTLSGFGINSRADIWGFMENPAKPGTYLYFWNWGWIDNTHGSYYFEITGYDSNWNYAFDGWDKPGKRNLYILKCGTNWNSPTTGCWKTNDGDAPTDVATLRAQGNLLWSGEVNYTPDYPTQVSASPNKGSINGGNKIRIRGHHLQDYRTWNVPEVKIGDQLLTNVRWINQSDIWDPNSIDVLEGTVPASLKSGTYPITLTNHLGANVLSVKYTYSSKPEITTIAPAAVSNSGGSLITLTGKNFGTSGTPAVTIDGVKSPCVTRVSDTKVVAMVPALTKTGAVDVNMISGAGGGSPDLPSSITLNAAGTAPTITKVAPASVSIGGGDEVVLTGTGFGAAGTVGVMVGANCARVTASTSTSITFEAPSGDAAGAANITVGSTAGTLVKVGALSYIPTPGVSKVEPSSIPSYATGDAAKITITGNNFGTAGKIKFGSNAAVNYTATDGGTKISGVVVPNNVAGIVLITITPTGATTPFTSSIRIRAPKPTYFGPNPHKTDYEWSTGWEVWKWAAPVTSSPAGGAELLIEGTDFGTAGTVKIGTTAATIKSWSDTAVVITSPPLSVGAYDVTITPSTGGGVAATLPTKLNYMAVAVAQPTIASVAATVDNGRTNAQHTFDAELDRSDVFQVTGTSFTGTDAGATTKVYLKDDNSDWVAVSAYDLTATSFKFHAPRSYIPVRWVAIRVVTNIGDFMQLKGILYVGNAPQPITFGGWYGLCANTAIAGYAPSNFTASGPSGTFGNSGTVTIGGVAFPADAVTWSDTSVQADFGSIASSWTTLWGNQTVVFTPSDTNLIPRTFNYFCGVATTVTTKLNNSTSDLTIAAGTAYTASASFANPITGFDYTPSATGYQYVKASDWAQWGFGRNVVGGLPEAAGEYYIRVTISQGTYDATKYATLTWTNEMHLTITGTAVTFTPKLTSGSGTEITYSGPITDGTDGRTANFTYTKTATTDAVTAVFWEYRDHLCAGNNNVGWYQGLPQSVAIAPQGCGGDGTSVSSWDIRVRSFDMVSGGVNKNIYYLPTYEIFTLKINKKALTISKVKAEKVYDGSTAISFNEIEVTGAVNDEVPTLNSQVSSGNFNDATSGTGKTITLGGTLSLYGSYNVNYYLTNPDIVFTGSINKADATLRLTSAVPSVIMTNPAPFDVTAVSRDNRNGQVPAAEAAVSPIVITSGTPSVCSISGNTVTPLKAGDCVINATQAASTNYNAAKSYQDDSLTVESITIKIFATPKAVQVVADDITLATGETITPASQVIGLIDGDELNTVVYDYYQGTTLLAGAPTDPGTYKIVPRDATLTAADMAAYQPDFKYVAGKLVITQVPPILASMTPGNGPEAGGTKVTIVGERLGDITSISWGTLTIRKPNFVVNGDGTEITLTVPKGTGQVDVIMRAGVIEMPTTYVYDAPVVPPTPAADPKLSLKLALEVGAKLAGQDVTIQGGGLKANSDYVLELHSTTVVIYQGVTDANGNFLKKIVLPAKACLEAGKHSFLLKGIKPDGATASDTAYFQLGDKCVVGQGQAVKTVVNDKVTWTLSGFLYKYRDEHLTTIGKKSLDQLFKLIKGAKTVKIYGYTETDTKSAVIKKANLILAKARCAEAMKYLKSKGLNAKFYLFGKGGVNPVSLIDQSQNRRVVIEATY